MSGHSVVDIWTPSAEPGRMFVGRRPELELLSAELEGAASGSMPIVLIHGEAGIGKTRLMTEFAGSPRARAATVLRGACFEGGGAPYGPWVEAVGRHLSELDASRLAEALGAGAAALADLVPRIRELIADVPSSPALPSAEGQLRLYEAVASFLDALPGPRLLMLDDFQWAEPATLDLLSYIARFATSTLIVASYRGSDLDLDHPLSRRLAEINRHRPCRYLTLSSLSAEAAADLVADVVGRRVDTRLMRTLYAESGGNPFFLIELARHLHDDRVRHAGEHGEARLPQSVRAAVALRLASLSAPCRTMLERAVVFTAGIEFRPLQAVTKFEEDELLDCVEEALRTELWVEMGPDRYDFAHALVRHALYDRFSPSRRARLHRRLAEVLEQEDEAHVDKAAPELARQYYASASLPGARRGVLHAQRAAEQALRAHAPQDAVVFLRIALTLIPACDLSAEASVTGDLAVALAEASLVAEALPTLERAVSLLERAGAPRPQVAHLIYRVVSVLEMAYSTHEAIDRLIAAGLEQLGEGRGIAWARLKLLERGFAAIPAGRSYSMRFEGLDAEAVEVARRQGNEADFARTIDIMAWLPLAEIERLAERVEGFEDESAKLRVLDVLAMSLALRHGAPPVTERFAAQVEDLAPKIGSLATQAMAHVYRASILGASGELEASLVSFEAAEAVASRIPTSQIAHGAAWMRELTAQHVRPDWRQMAENCWRIATDPHQVVWFSSGAAATAALALASQGERDQALSILADLIPALSRHEATDFVQSVAVGQAAEALWELGDAELAETLLSEAQALLEAQTGDWYMTSNDLSVARLQTLLTDRDAALAHFDRARIKLSRVEQHPLVAIVDHDEAVARRELGQPHASLLLAQATRQFARMGMREWQSRVSHASSTRSGLPAGLTPREVEVLRLVAAGATNRQIAADLVLSVFTVERHLANAYRKINVRNRANAAAYVVGHNL